MSPPLPVTLDLRPGQALDCYLEHLAEANGMSTAGLLTLVRGGGGSSTTRFLMLHPPATTTRRLACVARLEPAEVAAATLAAYDGTALDLAGLDPQALSSFRAVAARGWVPGHGTQLCPPCLAATGIWQLPWRLPTVTVCLTHATYLLAGCPGCGRPFRDQRHSPLRRAGTSTQCGNPLGQGPTRQCLQELTALPTVRAEPPCLRAQQRRNTAAAGHKVRVLGTDVPGVGYLQDLRHLTTVLLHLANQPGGLALAPWANELAAEATARTGRRGPRWGMRPPTDPALRSRALRSADDILTCPTVEDAAAAFVPWLQTVPRTASGSLGWLANRTVMTPTLTRIIMAAHAPHRTLSHRLDTHLGLDAPMCRLPQVLPTVLYRAHLAGLFDSDPDTVALFASLCLARAHPQSATWSAAAAALRLPPELGQRTAPRLQRHSAGEHRRLPRPPHRPGAGPARHQLSGHRGQHPPRPEQHRMVSAMGTLPPPHPQHQPRLRADLAVAARRPRAHPHQPLLAPTADRETTGPIPPIRYLPDRAPTTAAQECTVDETLTPHRPDRP